uniref:SHSP domain-containing protein n=1 Tax=Cyclophora tenuis TaxID=216820 RepID=A0A7S1D1Z3_CYCTE
METSEAFKLSMDVPGVAPKDLDVAVNWKQRRIELTGYRRGLADDEEHQHSYFHSWYVDTSVQIEDLVMQYEHGVVVICVPKPKQPSEPKISIRTSPNPPELSTLSSKAKGGRGATPRDEETKGRCQGQDHALPFLQLEEEEEDDDEVNHWLHKM